MSIWKPKPKNYIITVNLHGSSVVLHDESVTLQFDDNFPLLVGTAIAPGKFWITVPNSYPTFYGSTLNVVAPGYVPYSQRVLINGKAQTIEVQLTLAIKRREGIVRQLNRNLITDDTGPFYGLGHTLFWALRGWKYERDRIREHFSFLSRNGFDYYRALCCVDWLKVEDPDAGNFFGVDPDWPDFQFLLADMLDVGYNQYGLRAELTLIGGFPEKAIDVAHKVSSVIFSRPQTIFDIEMANEWTLRNISLDTLKEMSQIIRSGNTDNLVFISDAEGFTFDEYRAGALIIGGANAMSLHPDRGLGDLGYRPARQTWEWKELSFPLSVNEPLGPRSSFQEETDPLRLSMNRATAMLMDCCGWVFHNANCVSGEVITNRNRLPNAWDVPNVELAMKACRNIDKFLPAGINGRYWNNHWSGNPCPVDNVWPDPNPDRGVTRHYLRESSDGFYSVLLGINGFVNFLPSRPVRIDLYNPATDTVIVKTGSSLKVDAIADGEAFICHGVWL